MDHRGAIHLVDDNEGVRAAFSFLLEKLGYDVFCHESGERFFEALPTAPRGPVLLDIEMPGMRGSEVIREMRRQGLDWPVIVITAESDFGLAASMIARGVDDYLVKPVSRTRIVEALDRLNWLSGNAKRREAEREALQQSLARLTDAEIDVLTKLMSGLPVKVIAWDLGLNVRVVDNHRINITRKLGVRGIIDAILLARRSGRFPDSEQSEMSF